MPKKTDPGVEPAELTDLAGEPELVSEIDDVTTVLWERTSARRSVVARARLADAIDRLLDSLARSVVERPLDIQSSDDAMAHIERLANEVSGRAGSAWSLWVLGRARRLLVRRWRMVPSAAAIAVVTSLLTSITCGVIELRVLGSMLVHRMRRENREIDPRVVRRVVLACYLDPRDASTDTSPSRLAGARLLAKWTRDAFPVWNADRSTRRATRAARAIDALDLATTRAISERT